MTRKILVPVDGSGHAERAVERASELALKLGADLLILHAMQRVGSARVPEGLERYAEIEHIEITERDVMNKVANDIVNAAVGRAREHGVAGAAGHVVVGDPAKSIVDFAKANDVALIVMGRRGLGDLQGLLFGSVSHKVLQLADCDCLTVK